MRITHSLHGFGLNEFAALQKSTTTLARLPLMQAVKPAPAKTGGKFTVSGGITGGGGGDTAPIVPPPFDPAGCSAACSTNNGTCTATECQPWCDGIGSHYTLCTSACGAQDQNCINACIDAVSGHITSGTDLPCMTAKLGTPGSATDWIKAHGLVLGVSGAVLLGLIALLATRWA